MPNNRLALMTIDINDMKRAVEFWSKALHGQVEGEIGEKHTMIKVPGSSVKIFLQLVPEKKSAKTRMHLDIEASDTAAEVKRLQKLGAKVIQKVPPSGFRYGVLQDPFGNEFCVLPAPI